MGWKNIGNASADEIGAFRALKRSKLLVDESLGKGVTEVLRRLRMNVTGAWEQALLGKDDKAVFQRACPAHAR